MKEINFIDQHEKTVTNTEMLDEKIWISNQITFLLLTIWRQFDLCVLLITGFTLYMYGDYWICRISDFAECNISQRSILSWLLHLLTWSLMEWEGQINIFYPSCLRRVQQHRLPDNRLSMSNGTQEHRLIVFSNTFSDLDLSSVLWAVKLRHIFIF